MTKRLGATMIAAVMTLAGASSVQAAPVAAAEALPVDAAKLAEARRITAKLLPPGVYRTVMGSALAPVMEGMGSSLKALPLRQMAEMGGLSATQAAALDKVDIERVLAIYDPHWEERSRLTMRAMMGSMADFFSAQEPELREAYAHAYADRFTLPELHSLDAFFDTPAGAKFATQYLTMATDPTVTAEMRAMMPKLMAQMPAMMEAAKKATASLPPPRKLDQLTPAERAQLAKALNVPESRLKDVKSTL